MILLLALPVIAAVALAHRYLTLYAPSNVLIRHARVSQPTLRMLAMTAAVTASLLVATKMLTVAVALGAPGWLNVVVLVLAWDAIKIGWLAIAVLFRWLGVAASGTVGRRNEGLSAASYS